MATSVQLRRGTTGEHSTFAGAVAEVTVDTDKNVPVVHDGTTQGGFPLALESDLTSLETNFNNHEANVSNPHSVTKSQVGLGNVTNDQQVPKDGGSFTGVVTMDGVNFVVSTGASAEFQDSSNNTVASIYGDGTKGAVVSGEGTVDKITFRTGGVDRMTIDSAGVPKINGNVVWHAGNDGAGSGLNADFLDGKDSNHFATQNAFDTHANDTGNPHQVTDEQTGLVGKIEMFGGDAEPSGWLFCTGQEVSRTTYSDLFNVIGTKYGAGDGSSTFNVPDMRERSPLGGLMGATDPGRVNNYSTGLGDSGGEDEHQLTENEMPSHNHGGVPSYTLSSGDTEGGSGRVTGNGSTTHAGGDQAHNNMHPFAVVNFIIKT